MIWRCVTGAPRPLRILVGVVLSFALAAVLAGPANAYLYWTPGIQTSQLDGSNQQTLVSVEGDQIAVDGAHIYWTDPTTSTIGRANLDGSQPNPNFISLDEPIAAIAVDGQHIYWANQAPTQESIGRANLDGSGVQNNFVPLGGSAGTPNGVAVDGTYVYWTAYASNKGVIGRAKLDGSSPQPSFVTLALYSDPAGMAVNGSFIYFADGDAVGRASLDGSSFNEHFVPLAKYSRPSAVAVDSTHLYWNAPGACSPSGCNVWSGAIGQANLDGTGANPNLLTGVNASSGGGLAVDSLEADPTSTTVACSPQTVGVFQNDTGPEWWFDDCTATVRDTGTAPHAPNGTVTFSFRGNGFNEPEQGSCVLKPGGSGSASCTVTYSPSYDNVIYPPGGAGGVTATAAYSGETQHLASTGTGTYTLTTHIIVNSGTGHHGGGGPACRVPRVLGKTLAAARKAITKAHCKVGKVARKHSSRKKKGHVLSQKPRSGTRKPAGAKIDLVVGK